MKKKSKKYVIDKLIGRGKHSVVFIVHDFSGSYCLKIERISLSTQIHNEVDNLKKLSGCPGVPKLIFHGEVVFSGTIWYAIITNVIGTSITETINSGGFLSDSECFDLAQKVIPILNAIHEHGLIHGDIKPEHIVFFKDDLYLIDYGASVPPLSFPIAYTQKYSARSTLTETPVAEDTDFENLWWCLLSLCQHLPWEREKKKPSWCDIQLRSSYIPKKVTQSYPKLASCFVDLF